MACFIQRHIADVGFIVTASTGEIHFTRIGATTPVKDVRTFAGIDYAAGYTAADINGVIAFAGLNGHGRVVDGLQGSRVGNGFTAVAAGVNNR